MPGESPAFSISVYRGMFTVYSLQFTEGSLMSVLLLVLIFLWAALAISNVRNNVACSKCL